eukprot:CFRG3305T1
MDQKATSSVIPRELVKSEQVEENEGGRAHFTVLQFNALADSLAYREAFPISDPECLHWEHRYPLILEEITRFNPTIICLQEVDHYNQIENALMQNGYSGKFLKKCNDDSLDGCAIFFKTHDFIFLHHIDFSYREVLENEDNQVALSMMLEHLPTGRKVHVVTTHLKAKDEFEDVRLLQINALLTFLSQEKFGTTPLIVCGDLNSEPNGKVYAHIVQHEGMNLDSAYRMALGQEPHHTTLKHRPPFTRRRTIDYIFYSQKHFTPTQMLRIPTEDEKGGGMYNFTLEVTILPGTL